MHFLMNKGLSFSPCSRLLSSSLPQCGFAQLIASEHWSMMAQPDKRVKRKCSAQWLSFLLHCGRKESPHSFVCILFSLCFSPSVSGPLYSLLQTVLSSGLWLNAFMHGSVVLNSIVVHQANWSKSWGEWLCGIFLPSEVIRRETMVGLSGTFPKDKTSNWKQRSCSFHVGNGQWKNNACCSYHTKIQS